MGTSKIDTVNAGGGIMVDIVEQTPVKMHRIKPATVPRLVKSEAFPPIAKRVKPRLPIAKRIHKKIQPKRKDHNVNFEDVPRKTTIARSTRKLISEALHEGQTVRLYLIDCGKDKCKKCRRGPSHGPYWYGFKKNAAGKQVSKYIGKNLHKKVKHEANKLSPEKNLADPVAGGVRPSSGRQAQAPAGIHPRAKVPKKASPPKRKEPVSTPV